MQFSILTNTFWNVDNFSDKLISEVRFCRLLHSPDNLDKYTLTSSFLIIDIYRLLSRQIHFRIYTNTCQNFNKYILQLCRQIEIKGALQLAVALSLTVLTMFLRFDISGQSLSWIWFLRHWSITHLASDSKLYKTGFFLFKAALHLSPSWDLEIYRI